MTNAKAKEILTKVMGEKAYNEQRKVLTTKYGWNLHMVHEYFFMKNPSAKPEGTAGLWEYEGL